MAVGAGRANHKISGSEVKHNSNNIATIQIEALLNSIPEVTVYLQTWREYSCVVMAAASEAVAFLKKSAQRNRSLVRSLTGQKQHGE